MRIWNCCVSIIVLALAFTCWRFGDWTEHSPENEGMDGTCQGLQALLAYFLAAVLSALSIIPLFIRKHHIDRWNTPPEQRSKEGIITRPGRDYDRLFD